MSETTDSESQPETQDNIVEVPRFHDQQRVQSLSREIEHRKWALKREISARRDLEKQYDQRLNESAGYENKLEESCKALKLLTNEYEILSVQRKNEQEKYSAEKKATDTITADLKQQIEKVEEAASDLKNTITDRETSISRYKGLSLILGAISLSLVLMSVLMPEWVNVVRDWFASKSLG